jgi:hypothetical protein
MVKAYNEENNEFTVELLNGESEHVTYNLMLDAYNQEEDPEEKLWKFNKITNHQTHRDKQQVEVLWTNGEVSWEPVPIPSHWPDTPKTMI